VVLDEYIDFDVGHCSSNLLLLAALLINFFAFMTET